MELFEFAVSLCFPILRGGRTKIAVHIRLDGVDLFALFFELGSFVVKPLLLFGEAFLLCLERLQARKFSISLNGKERTLSRLKDHQLGFVFCSECALVLCLLEGFIDRLEPLIIADVFDEGLHLTQSRFNFFQFLAGALIGAVDVFYLSFKVSILEKIILGEIVERLSSFLEIIDLRPVFISFALLSLDAVLDTLAGIGVSLGLSMNFEAVTARYVDVRLERKKKS